MPEPAQYPGREAHRGPVVPVGYLGGSNYRASCRGRSRADFIAKLGVVLEETDESLFWLEIIVETEVLPEKLVAPLIGEAHELVSIFVAGLNTAKS